LSKKKITNQISYQIFKLHWVARCSSG